MRSPAIHRFVFLLSFLTLAPFAVWAEDPGRSTAKRLDGIALERDLRGRLSASAHPKWKVGVVVMDPEGNALFSNNAREPLSPASNQKILVVVAALALLGLDFEYETFLVTSAAPRSGEIGDLVVQGRGDPNISGRFHGGDPTAIFKSWASHLKGVGVQHISGDLVVDDFYFDEVRFLPGWKEDQAGSWYSAEVGALNLNDNCIDVTVRPSRPGQPARVELNPRTRYITIENQCKTTSGTKGEPIFHRRPGTNKIVVRKSIQSRRKEFTSTVTVHDPGMYFGMVLSEVLQAEGISLGGQVVRGTLGARAGVSPNVLYRHPSRLSDDLTVINKRSQNLHAEVLLKTLGARIEGEGSVAAGGRAIEGFLERASIERAGLNIEDGSGLASGNRVCAATLAGVLAWIQQQPYFQSYLDSLPVAGEDGTLKRRFGTKKCSGHVFAKTGYINDVSALSGYVERDGSYWVFSVLVNGLRSGGTLSRARSLQEEIAEAIYLAMPRAAP